LEKQHEVLSHKMASPDYYKDSALQAKQDSERLNKLDAEILTAYEQWESLESE
jgi:hypothetical protein